ncbi:hypothetical protein ACFU98_05175 [Streptomyces sp. NPDC057575]|uniref:hypothetical protein n=1 Tax=unclassified Streptomyces TaxID=2593676 RepID=UPI003679DECF
MTQITRPKDHTQRVLDTCGCDHLCPLSRTTGNLDSDRKPPFRSLSVNREAQRNLKSVYWPITLAYGRCDPSGLRAGCSAVLQKEKPMVKSLTRMAVAGAAAATVPAMTVSTAQATMADP